MELGQGPASPRPRHSSAHPGPCRLGSVATLIRSSFKFASAPCLRLVPCSLAGWRLGLRDSWLQNRRESVFAMRAAEAGPRASPKPLLFNLLHFYCLRSSSAVPVMRSILVLTFHYAFKLSICTCRTEGAGVPNEQQSQRPQLQCWIRAGRLNLHASIILPAPRLHTNPIRSSLRLCNQLDRTSPHHFR
jgi:hypothetical protein